MNDSIHNYERRLVVFFDFLGWKGRIEGAGEDPILVSALARALTLVSTTFTDSLTKDDDVVWTSFSDNVVVSWTYGLDKLSAVIEGLCRLQLGMAVMGFYIRGGLTVGSLIHIRNKIVFGPALNRAYELESRYANFPRIILDPNVPELAINSFCIAQDEEFTFLNPFSYEFISHACTNLNVSAQGASALNEHVGIEFIQPSADILVPFIAELYMRARSEFDKAPSARIREIYGWLLERLNQTVGDIPSD